MTAQALCAATLLAAGPQAPAAELPWTTEGMHADLIQIGEAVREQWSYLEDRTENFGFDLDRALAEAQAELGEVATPGDWERAVRRFAAKLQDGHAIVRVPGLDPEPARRLPFEVADCERGLIVSLVGEVAAPHEADRWISLDRVPIEQALSQAEQVVFGSTPGMRRRLALERVLTSDAQRVRCGFERPTLETYEVELATLPEGEALPLPHPRPENWSLRWWTAVYDGSGTWPELTISSFKAPRWDEWLEASQEEREPFLAEAKARIDAIVRELLEREATSLTIDLRGNSGGTDSLGIYLAERLLSGPFRYFLLSSKRDGAWTPPHGLEYGTGDHPRFLGPLTLLVDAGSFSTTDNFVRCMTDLHPDVTVVGQPTGGGTGAPRVFVTTEHTGTEFGACTMRVYGPAGELTEGRGTVPDELVVGDAGCYGFGASLDPREPNASEQEQR